MKISDLKPGDKFAISWHNIDTDEVEMTVTGRFIGLVDDVIAEFEYVGMEGKKVYCPADADVENID